MRRIILAALLAALPALAIAQPACDPAHPATLACERRAVNPHPADVVSGTQVTGPDRASQSMQIGLDQILAMDHSTSAVTATGTSTTQSLADWVSLVLGRSPISAATVAATGSDTTPRTLGEWLSDLNSLPGSGGIAAGSASVNSAAVARAEGLGASFVPPGLYPTNLPQSSIYGPFWGYGQIVDNSSNKLAKQYVVISAQPSRGDETSFATAFNGDWSHVLDSTGYAVTGTSTLGTPATGYLFTPEATPHYTYLYNSSGWNQSTSGNDGRTNVGAYRTAIYNVGQGDAQGYSSTCFVNSSLPGATSYLANPECGVIGGDTFAGSDGVYLDADEMQMQDFGHDAAAAGLVRNFYRNNDTGALKAWWVGTRLQSNGTKRADVAYSAAGGWNFGLDLSYVDFGTNQAAVTLAANQRIYGNVGHTDSIARYPTSLGADYITYSTSRVGWVVVAAGVPALQVSSNAVTSSVPLVVPQGVTAGTYLRIPFGTPASSSAACNQGQIVADATYIYTCVATNTWHRLSNGTTW